MSQVSVVIAAFDAERYLGEAIESVLGQTRAPLELIVVDDGSDDHTLEVARGFGERITCVGQPRSGVSAALNRGVEMARGDQLAFLDADDLWTQDKLALQVKALERAPQLDMVFGHVMQFRSTELAPEELGPAPTPPNPVPGICRGAMLIRSEAFRRAGRFATRWRLGEFLEWYARALDAGLIGSVLPDVVMHRRLHAANSGIREREGRSDFPRILRTVIDRRRAAQT
jgi:glycosyltransferase involved in cell wall biosynthesis